MATTTTISQSEIELSEIMQREENNELSLDEVIQWFKEVCFDKKTAEEMLGDIVMCTKDHEDIHTRTPSHTPTD